MTIDGKPGLIDEKRSPTASSSEAVEYGHSSAVKNRFGFSLVVDQEPTSFAATPNASNADFDPIPPSKRTWTWAAYVAYWMADAWAVSNWEVGQLTPICYGSDHILTSSLSLFNHRCRAQLEICNWCLRSWKYIDGHSHHNQW